MTLDELLLEWSYRSEKGYPSLDNPSDISILKEILEQLDLPTDDVLDKISYANKDGKPGITGLEPGLDGDEEPSKPSYTPKHKKINTRKAIDVILNSKYAQEHKFKKMSDAYRIGNLDKIDKDRFMEILIDLFNNPQIVIHSPKSGPNVSSKYNMFEFEWEGEGPVSILLAGGANKGEVYEQDLLTKMQGSFGLPMDEIEFEEIKTLFTRLNIDPEDYTPDDVFFAGAADTKRQLSFEGPIDLGSKVADIIIDTKGKPTYLSIKDIKGSGIYNGGNVTFVRMEGEKAIFDKDKYNEKPLMRDIFEACGIDPQKMADGINAYITKKGDQGKFEVSNNVDLDKIRNLLASSFGYGYWYVREKKGDNLFVHYIDGVDGAYDMVGNLDPDSVKIKYPGTTSKNLDVVIETDSPVFKQDEGKTPLRYQIVIRNAAGKIFPARLNIRTNK